MLRPVLAVLLAALASAPAAPGDPAALPLKAARDALAAGRRAEAALHALEALVHRPESTEVLELLLVASAGDADATAVWAHAWIAAAADERGRAKPAGDVRDALAGDASLAAVAAARAAAAQELARFAEAREKNARREPTERVVAWWARRAALDVASGSPALRAAHAQALAHEVAAGDAAHESVVAALKRVLDSALANGRTDEAVRAARCLVGLGTQAAFDDLVGPRPSGMERVREHGERGLERAREQLRAKEERPWTVDELEELRRAEGEAFTRAHATFGRPAVAVSPDGLYRIETDCGYETLLGVAKTVELHHRRLAGWYGRDPFATRPGLVRVVPEAHGLEAEGTPFWWAGGFQSGDITTVRFSVGTIEGLGRLLTHELTHRFDGALFPGIPAWLAEGKAVWTGAAYGGAKDERFVANHASFGTIEGAMIDGYGDARNLEKLVTGTLDDYRDNYVAGYALYVYLATWEQDGRPLFAGRLEPFQAGAEKGARDPLAWFVKHFADGADGRPDGFEAFAKGFDEFVSGFYWQNPKPFTSRYAQNVPDTASDDGWVYDEPTWVWSRERAEPSFGQDQARAAGELFAELGRDEDALHALTWALAADGRSPRTELALAALGRASGARDAVWVLERAQGFPSAPPSERAPFADALPKTRALLGALADAARAYAASERPLAAAALAADHDRLADRIGFESLALAPPAQPTALARLDRPERRLGLEGWVESGLTNYEDRRVEHLWYVDDDGDLHVGREEPRTGTGSLDRRAHQRDAFARTDEWLLPGTYRVRTRVRITTSFVSGAVVIGHTRRDRNVRFDFSAGDFLYSIGAEEEQTEIDSVAWSLTGLRDRDGALPGARPGGQHDFGRPVPAFELELLVDGASVTAFAGGERLGTYHTVDGAPIEGHVGFAVSMGAIEVQRPTVQRLDRTALATRPSRGTFELFVNRALRGLAPSPSGTVLVRIAPPDLDGDGEYDGEYLARRAVECGEKAAELVRQFVLGQPVVVAVPDSLGEEHLASVRAQLGALEPAPAVVTYPTSGPAAPRDAGGEEDGHWVIVVDPAGVVRRKEPFYGYESAFSFQTEHWLRVLGREGSKAELPPVPERAEPGEAARE